jgi:ribosomal protein S27AE
MFQHVHGVAMHRLPAHCPHCGAFFLSPIAGMPGASVTIHAVGTSCPRCGKSADVLDGTFDFLANAIHVKSAPPKTLGILHALQDVLSQAQKGADEQEIIQALSKESPELAHAASDVIKRGGVSALIALLIYLLASCSANIEQTLDWNELVDQAHVYLIGADPYPLGESRTQDQETREPSQQTSRQQRRHRERQSKKQKPKHSAAKKGEPQKKM